MVWKPVLLSLLLGPGVGQLYNRDFQKGACLIIASLAVLVASIVWVHRVVSPYITPEFLAMDPFEAAARLQHAAKGALQANAGKVLFYHLLLMGMWAYSIVDAYVVAKNKQAAERKE